MVHTNQYSLKVYEAKLTEPKEKIDTSKNIVKALITSISVTERSTRHKISKHRDVNNTINQQNLNNKEYSLQQQQSTHFFPVPLKHLSRQTLFESIKII